ncbi:hypothetical protein [Paracoccus hibiscisoli]|uniref:Uncharacterized protein n=1 Tax=Paracoccus hibiscisoli TaxID=2023261 RepID=A0A4U0QYF6_9RHOB|nr:hypothetical protein [Paracoccus hibiscisoli]TJZ81074.1 hypothetical protein FA740_16400 [Paracoccus hibiscisoli]
MDVFEIHEDQLPTDADDIWRFLEERGQFDALLIETRAALIGDLEGDPFHDAVRRALSLMGPEDNVREDALENPLAASLRSELEGPGGLAAACFRRLRGATEGGLPDLAYKAHADAMIRAMGDTRKGLSDALIAEKIGPLLKSVEP